MPRWNRKGAFLREHNWVNGHSFTFIIYKLSAVNNISSKRSEKTSWKFKAEERKSRKKELTSKHCITHLTSNKILGRNSTHRHKWKIKSVHEMTQSLKADQFTLTLLPISTEMITNWTFASVTSQRIYTGILARVGAVGWTLIHIWKRKMRQM